MVDGWLRVEGVDLRAGPGPESAKAARWFARFWLDKRTGSCTFKLVVADNQQLTHKGTGAFPAGDIRTRRRKVNANEADNQQLTPESNAEGPILDKRQAVA
jgi:hypothetical protein